MNNILYRGIYKKCEAETFGDQYGPWSWYFWDKTVDLYSTNEFSEFNSKIANSMSSSIISLRCCYNMFNNNFKIKIMELTTNSTWINNKLIWWITLDLKKNESKNAERILLIIIMFIRMLLYYEIKCTFM